MILSPHRKPFSDDRRYTNVVLPICGLRGRFNPDDQRKELEDLDLKIEKGTPIQHKMWMRMIQPTSFKHFYDSCLDYALPRLAAPTDQGCRPERGACWYATARDAAHEPVYAMVRHGRQNNGRSHEGRKD